MEKKKKLPTLMLTSDHLAVLARVRNNPIYIPAGNAFTSQLHVHQLDEADLIVRDNQRISITNKGVQFMDNLIGLANAINLIEWSNGSD